MVKGLSDIENDPHVVHMDLTRSLEGVTPDVWSEGSAAVHGSHALSANILHVCNTSTKKSCNIGPLATDATYTFSMYYSV